MSLIVYVQLAMQWLSVVQCFAVFIWLIYRYIAPIMRQYHVQWHNTQEQLRGLKSHILYLKNDAQRERAFWLDWQDRIQRYMVHVCTVVADKQAAHRVPDTLNDRRAIQSEAAWYRHFACKMIPDVKKVMQDRYVQRYAEKRERDLLLDFIIKGPAQ